MEGFSGARDNLTFLDGRLHVETDRPGKEREGEGIYTWVSFVAGVNWLVHISFPLPQEQTDL